MAPKIHTIEVDEATAIALRGRAEAQGLSVSELVAGMTAITGTPVALSAAELAELDHQWTSVKSGEATVPHEEVASWLQTWGTPAFKPWRDQ
jgi:predicted transcriptional regulator